ncbi:hypothetical protein [Poseidonocella sp. HB161398]|uniref:hypothetical protein n=1 Tax=Poseidonocella sp. HB161398 TaxID=2320855 RepID=UPI0011087970|nr:hypothetical protein [Poseidonocella sp. HB161398]
MRFRAALLLAGAGLAGCSAWQGGSTAVAPVATAGLQLAPSAPTGTAPVAPAPDAGRTGSRGENGVVPLARAEAGQFAVQPSAVAEARLQPSAPTGTSTVAPVAATGSVSLQRAGIRPSAAPAAPRAASVSAAANPVNFALSTSHPVGQPVYPRSAGAAAAGCGRYVSGVAAQQAFLEAGGPQSDRLGLDPDGDGYACSFDPEPYRRAARS